MDDSLRSVTASLSLFPSPSYLDIFLPCVLLGPKSRVSLLNFLRLTRSAPPPPTTPPPEPLPPLPLLLPFPTPLSEFRDVPLPPLGMGRIVDCEKTEFLNIWFLALNGRFSYFFFGFQTDFSHYLALKTG